MIHRLKKGRENPYVMVPKSIYADSRLSMALKGFLGYLLSKPDDWQFFAKQLASETTEDRNTLARYFKALVGFGYVTRKQLYEQGRKAGYQYTVYETPIDGALKTSPVNSALLSNDITKGTGKPAAPLKGAVGVSPGSARAVAISSAETDNGSQQVRDWIERHPPRQRADFVN